MSDSNRTALAYLKETTWSVVPANPDLQRLRFTKETLEHGKITVQSQEIRPDRQMGEKVLTGVEAKGSVEFELSVGGFDAFLQAALQSAFANVGNVPTMTNGLTFQSFLLEKRIANDTHLQYHGMVLDQLTLNFASRALITGTMSFMGTQATLSDNTINHAAVGEAENYTAASNGLLLAASANVGTVSIDGTALSSIKTLSLTVANNLRGNDVIGKPQIDEVGVGACVVSGKVEAYFRTPALLLAFMQHKYVAIVLEVSRAATDAEEGDHIGYRFTLPKVEFDKGNTEITGVNTDVMLPLDFTAVADDGATGYTIKVEKLLQPA